MATFPIEGLSYDLPRERIKAGLVILVTALICSFSITPPTSRGWLLSWARLLLILGALYVLLTIEWSVYYGNTVSLLDEEIKASRLRGRREVSSRASEVRYIDIQRSTNVRNPHFYLANGFSWWKMRVVEQGGRSWSVHLLVEARNDHAINKAARQWAEKNEISIFIA